MAHLINPIDPATRLEISGLDITQIDPTEFVNFNKIQLLAFTDDQLNAMSEEQRLAYNTANNEKPDVMLHFIGP